MRGLVVVLSEAVSERFDEILVSDFQLTTMDLANTCEDLKGHNLF
jgi:hypothetical protein